MNTLTCFTGIVPKLLKKNKKDSRKSVTTLIFIGFTMSGEHEAKFTTGTTEDI